MLFLELRYTFGEGDFMAVVYYYAKNEALPIYLKYGIRLSKNFDINLNISGYEKPYLIGLLNPKDDLDKYTSSEFTCIKLDVLNNHLWVADFSEEVQNHTVTECQEIEKYIFGSFLKPRVLIDTSIISDKISLYNRELDIPLLYDNSEDFYYEVQVQKRLDELSLKEIFERLS